MHFVTMPFRDCLLGHSESFGNIVLSFIRKQIKEAMVNASPFKLDRYNSHGLMKFWKISI